MAWAKILGYSDALDLLMANEQEEKAADAKLTKLAESTIKTDVKTLADELTRELAAVDEGSGTPSASRPASSGFDSASSTATT